MLNSETSEVSQALDATGEAELCLMYIFKKSEGQLRV